MKNLPLICVAALLGLAASLPAQRISFEGQFGRGPRGVVVVDAGGGRVFDGHRERRGDHRGDHRRQRGHWQTVHEQVLVPGYWRDEHVPPTYGWIVDRCGRRHWGMIDAGGCRRVWVPARYETRCRQVWVSC